MHKQEEILVTRLQKGERKAMEELYDTYAPVLLGVAKRYCSCHEEAEDMLHEALLKILKGIRDFNLSFEGAFIAWMKRVTVNQCLTALRKKIEFQQLDKVINIENTLLYEDDNDIDNYNEVQPEQIIEMIQSLPIGYRTVLNLYVFEEMSHKVIAQELKISENTSKSQLSKARNAMKKKLEELKFTALEEAKR